MRLLMVDDNPLMGDLVRKVSEQLGYTVETYIESAGFEAAVARAAPDVVVLDLNMPDVDGIALMRMLAAKGSRAKVFIMSGVDPINQMMAEKMGESLGLTMGAGSSPSRCESPSSRPCWRRSRRTPQPTPATASASG